jgi:hypothetical protein
MEQTPPETQPPPQPDRKLNEGEARGKIKAEDLRATIIWLSDPQREGRMSGTKGNKEAAEYIQQHFESYGLATELQQFPIQRGSNREAFSNNVIATYRGKSDRIIIIGGHMDHIGKEISLSRDQRPAIHPGADDNASGTSSVLELAEAFSKMSPREHTLKFIAFSGEELGLVGSKHYVAKLTPEEKGRIDLMVNFDMVGYLLSKDKLTLTGIKQIAEITDIVNRLNERGQYPFKVVPGGGDSGGSDHAPFGNAGVPYAFFFTGLHANYHNTTDTPDKLDYTGQENITKFAFDMICEFDKQHLVRKAKVTYPPMKETIRDHEIGIEFPED